jgi:hypothetical protein
VWTADGKVKRPKLRGQTDPVAAFVAEIRAAVRGVGAGREPEVLSGRLARDALAMCHRECQSVRTGKAVAMS